MKRLLFLCLPLALALVPLVLSWPVHAQDSVKVELKTTSRAAQELAAKTKAMQMDLADLQRRLVDAARKERALADDLRELSARTNALEAEQATRSDELKERRAALAELLVALARLGRLPPEIGLLRQEKTRDAVLAALLLQSALPEVRADAKRLAESLQNLERVQKDLQNQRAALNTARAEQAREREDIEALVKARQQKLQLTASEQAEISARLEKLRAEAANVGELVDKVATPSGARSKFSATAALALRGGMLQPVSGTLQRRFGERDASGAESAGLTFAVESGARIAAPAKGRVMFAGPFRGYGQIVILEHESDMHSMISGFSRIDVSVGQKVAQGEPLGLASTNKDSTGPDGAAKVYFELRNRGDPIDPRPRNR